MAFGAVEMRILEALEAGEIRGMAALGAKAFPSDEPGRNPQGLAVAVARFIRILEDDGFANHYVIGGDNSTKTFFITESGRRELEAERMRIAQDQRAQLSIQFK